MDVKQESLFELLDEIITMFEKQQPSVDNTVQAQHEQAQHLGLRYSCDKCDYKAKRKDSLKIHVQVKHEGVCYSCEQCDYKTTWKVHLKRHVDAQHLGVRYSCDK